MLGVVIWKCSETGRAVVWCADHQELAHFEGDVSVSSAEVGDLVRIELLQAETVRRCIQMDVLERDYMPAVADVLCARDRTTSQAA